MSLKLVLSVLASACITVACQNKQREQTSNTTAASANLETPDPKFSAAVAQTTASQTLTNQPALSVTSAKTLDLSHVHDINQDSDLSYLTPLFIAQTPRQMMEEEKLSLISTEYDNEADTFKKRELAVQLLPKVSQQIKTYQGTYLAKVPIINDQKIADQFLKQQNDKNLSPLSVNVFGIDTTRPYDFTTKTFAMSCEMDKFLSHGKYGGLGPFFGNKQSIQLDFLRHINDSTQYIVAPPQEKCELLVDDEAVAKKIEAARINNTLGGRGELYVQITADENQLKAKPLQATVSYLDTQTNETLATKTFHW